MREPEPAKHYLVFYFVGLGVSNFAFPVARCAVGSLAAALLRVLNLTQL